MCTFTLPFTTTRVAPNTPPRTQQQRANTPIPVSSRVDREVWCMSTGPGFNRGPGGGARGCGFEERAGAYARTEGDHSSSPRSLFVCLSVCLSYRTIMAVGLFKSKSSTHFPAQFSNTPNTRMPPPRFPWATRQIHARCLKRCS